MAAAIEERAGAGNTSPLPAAASGGALSYAWYVVFALSFVNLFNYLERLIPTLLFTPIKKDFHIDDTQVSLLAGFAFVLFYVGFGLVIGRLADRSNRRNIIAIGIVLWSLATMACGLARSFVQLFGARVAVGVGEATLAPSAISMISDYFPREKLARALSVYSAANFVGAGLSLVVGGLVIQAIANFAPPSLPLIGHISTWQLTFMVVGALGATVLIPMAFVREPERKGVAPVGQASEHASLGELAGFLRLNTGTFATIYIAFSILAIHGYGTVAWIPSYFERVHGWPAHEIGYVYGLMVAVLGALGVLSGARFAEWLLARGYTDAYFRAPIIVIAIAFVPQFLCTLMPDASLSLVLLAFCTWLANFSVALPIAALQTITPNRMRAQAVAIYMFVANIFGLGFGPTFVALVTDHIYGNEALVGYALSTATAVILPVSAILISFGLRPLRESLARTSTWAHPDVSKALPEAAAQGPV